MKIDFSVDKSKKETHDPAGASLHNVRRKSAAVIDASHADSATFADAKVQWEVPNCSCAKTTLHRAVVLCQVFVAWLEE
jgi:hypothetical protein